LLLIYLLICLQGHTILPAIPYAEGSVDNSGLLLAEVAVRQPAAGVAPPAHFARTSRSGIPFPVCFNDTAAQSSPLPLSRVFAAPPPAEKYRKSFLVKYNTGTKMLAFGCMGPALYKDSICVKAPSSSFTNKFSIPTFFTQLRNKLYNHF
jgi:hypothetical protein